MTETASAPAACAGVQLYGGLLPAGHRWETYGYVVPGGMFAAYPWDRMASGWKCADCGATPRYGRLTRRMLVRQGVVRVTREPCHDVPAAPVAPARAEAILSGRDMVQIAAWVLVSIVVFALVWIGLAA